ncbi:ATP-binding protein [Sphingomonas arenae]|uniref:ATP-binding protein n=1 Tax=Sphingomonas arenae TaxID=2812555 RepID=UPI0019676254|nr:ATP-binding protein [Sphingomonas arenae]
MTHEFEPPGGGRSVARHLVLFGAALALPVLILVAILTWHGATEERARTATQVEEVAASAVAALDREMVAYQSMLTALTTSPSLEAGDLRIFHERARRLALQEGIVISLRTRDGRQVLRSDTRFGTPLPRKSLPIDRFVIAERKPGVGDLELRQGKAFFSVVVPEVQDGRTAYLLTATVPGEEALRALSGVIPSNFWAGSYSDRNERIVVRTRDNAAWVGRPLTPALREAAQGRDRGTWEGPSHEGRGILGGFARSSVTGWLAAVGVERRQLAAPARDSMNLVTVAAILLALSSSLLALLFARTIVGPLSDLAGRARDLAEGRPVKPLQSGLREIDAVSAALVGAATALDERDTERRELLTRLETGNASLELEVERRAKEAEEALALLFQSQKMESLGRLTGGVAHDFNNLLTPIVSCLDLLRRHHDDPRSARLIDGAMASAERAAALVKHLLAFARRQSLNPRPTQPAQLVESMGDLIERSLGAGIDVHFDVPHNLPAALVDPNQLELALLNLSVNARDAMPNGGSLTVVAREVPVDAGEVPGLTPGRYIRFRIKDTGMGMDEETLRRAHEPFFTTKDVGQGTGLGLSMVHGLAAQSGGAFQLRSKPGLGTTAFLWLPAVQDEGVAPMVTLEAPAQAPCDATILLVDDDARVRTAAAEELRELGYTVVEAGSAEQALGLVRDGGGFDVLITDQVMPGMTGTELVEEARKLQPDLPVLLVTGFTDLDPGEDVRLLTKPFRHAELAAAVASLLPASPTPSGVQP